MKNKHTARQVLAAEDRMREARKSHVDWADHFKACQRPDCAECAAEAKVAGDEAENRRWAGIYDTVIEMLGEYRAHCSVVSVPAPNAADPASVFLPPFEPAQPHMTGVLPGGKRVCFTCAAASFVNYGPTSPVILGDCGVLPPDEPARTLTLKVKV
jgi:hypothetical protein